MPRLLGVAQPLSDRPCKSSISCSSLSHCNTSELPVGIPDWKEAPEPRTQQNGRSGINVCLRSNSLRNPTVFIFWAGIDILRRTGFKKRQQVAVCFLFEGETGCRKPHRTKLSGAFCPRKIELTMEGAVWDRERSTPTVQRGPKEN